VCVMVLRQGLIVTSRCPRQARGGVGIDVSCAVVQYHADGDLWNGALNLTAVSAAATTCRRAGLRASIGAGLRREGRNDDRHDDLALPYVAAMGACPRKRMAIRTIPATGSFRDSRARALRKTEAIPRFVTRRQIHTARCKEEESQTQPPLPNIRICRCLKDVPAERIRRASHPTNSAPREPRLRGRCQC
jgi:hypothetical protein